MENNKIYNTDCLDGLKLLDNESIDMILTSPPYDNLRTYNGYSFDFENIAKELFRVIKKGGVIVWVVGDAVIDGSESGTSFKQALYFMNLGLKLHDTMIYEKNSMSMPERNRYHQKFEYMFIFSKGKPKTFNPIIDHLNTAERWSTKFNTYEVDGSKNERKRSKEKNEYGMRFNIWKYNTGHGFTTKDKTIHPAMFPEKLAQDHILSWSNENDIVLDPFMGSGTTAKMCVLNNRKYIGFEISKEYYEASLERTNAIDSNGQTSIFTDFEREWRQ